MLGLGVNIWEPQGGKVYPESCIRDGTIVLAYDATRNYTLNGGNCSALAPIIGGTASDVLVQGNPALQPVWGPAAKLGGRTAIASTGTQWLRSAIPATALNTAQPFSIIWVGGCPSAGAAFKYFWDRADIANNNLCYRDMASTNVIMFGGVALAVGASQPLPGTILTATFAGAASTGRLRYDGGALLNAAGAAGAGNSGGFTVFANAVGNLPGNSLLSVLMVVTGLSAADTTRIERWTQLPPAKNGCGFSGWAP